MREITRNSERTFAVLDAFQIEIPSWGFANTGTRFGKFVQPGAATSIAEKFADAAEVHRLTGSTPTMALHVLWDLPGGIDDAAQIEELSRATGILPGSINPNLFQDQQYKFGSLCHPSEEVRSVATAHMSDSVRIAQRLRSRDISLWLPDGSNYPGTQSIRRRIGWLQEALFETHRLMTPEQRLLIEYKPYEPAFYHTDIADWGMALLLARSAGPQARVLVDTGHHYAAQNIEQIVAWLLHTGMLGGFHFNDRRYADDDLTLGSIDPYQVFRIFAEIQQATPNELASIAFMVDQSHNLKPKMEAMVQTVVTAQELWLKAALLDREQLQLLQDRCDLVAAEELFREAFFADVKQELMAWREARRIPANPLQELRKSGYIERIAQQRGNRQSGMASYA